MKTFSVNFTAYATVVIEAEDLTEAMQYAQQGISFGDFQMDEVEGVQLPDDAIEAAKRHADRVLLQ